MGGLGTAAPGVENVSAPEDPLSQAIAALRAALLESGAPHMLIGGMAVILRGVVRLTDDVDATVWGDGLDIELLVDTLSRHRITPRTADAVDFARERQVLLLRHDPSETPMELSLAWLPFEADALGRAELIAVGDAIIPVAVAQDLVIYKAVAWRERDRTDIERLLSLYGSSIDLDYVRRIVAEFAAALDEPERNADLERLIRRARDTNR
jgi:hypothetical protein